jgi:galactonate dehydratase
MKLSDLEVFVVAPPETGKGGRYWIFVKLTTACGIVGYGEVYAAGFIPAASRKDLIQRSSARSQA